MYQVVMYVGAIDIMYVGAIDIMYICMWVL